MTSAKKTKGFTLIELMIVVAIITLLATFAIPAYRDYVTRTKRSDAKVALMALQQAMEKYRANHPKYPSTIIASGGTCASGSYCLTMPSGVSVTSTQDNIMTYLSPKGYYNIGIVIGDATSYRLRAMPVVGGEQAGDTDCGRFFIVLDPTGVSRPQFSLTYDGSALSSSDCWK